MSSLVSALLVALPIVALPLLAAVVAVCRAGEPTLDRRALLVGAVAWGTLVLGGTELLSAWAALGRPGLALFWGGVDAVAVAVLLSRRRRLRIPDPEIPWAVVAPLAALAFATLVVALAAPPNTVDVLTYHLPRVMHWLQNHELRLYPTHIPRQDFMPPFAEEAILGLRALAGNDRAANLVSWLAFVGCGVAASEVARGLGLAARGQGLAAVLAMTSPMAVAQASSAKNDLVVAFWAIAFVALTAGELPARAGLRGLLAGGAAGLALATKATAAVLLAPFVLVWAVRRLRRRPPAWLEVTVAAAVAATLVAPAIVRNLAASGRPYGPADGGGVSRVTNAAFGPRTVVSNAVRNVALHAPVGDDGARWLTGAIRRGLGALGIDADDPATTFFEEPFALRPLSLHEERAGSPLQLVALACAAALLALRRPRATEATLQLGLVVAAFLLFCLAFKWQVWNARLHLPLFVLAAPATAAAFEGRRLALPLALLAVLAGFPAVLAGEPRALLGAESVLRLPRERQYFAFHPDTPAIFQSYRAVANYVATERIGSIGLVIANNHWEYPLWVFLGAPGDDAPTIRHVAVAGATAHLREPGDEVPVELVLWFRPPPSARDFVDRGRRYVRVLETPIVRGFRLLNDP